MRSFVNTLKSLDASATEELLWNTIADLQGTMFWTSGRKSMDDVEFKYTVKKYKIGL